MTTQTRVWLHGLFAAGIAAFSTSASGFLVLPTVFNFTSKDGLINMVKVSTVPTAIAVFGYLRKSPLPSMDSGPGDPAQNASTSSGN